LANVAIICHYAPSLINFRGELIGTLVNSGHKVTAYGPEAGFESVLTRLGANYQQIQLQRTGTNPMADLTTVVLLARALRHSRPDVVLSYAIKPVIYGSLAAWLAGVPRIASMITGVGYVFAGKTLKQRAIFRMVYPLYRAALAKNQVVMFQNPDDRRLFSSLKMISENQRQVLINGSGVNLERYEFSPAPVQPLSFLLIARLIWDKGIGEYVAAAKVLKRKYPEVAFRLLGPYDSNPSSIGSETIEEWVRSGVEYLGETDDVRPYLADTSVYVLPSYREGTPRSVLEAMSMGRPVITTDAPGCRETVQDGVNGFLVPVQDIKGLRDAMERFIVNPELIPEYGAKSREIAEEKYDVRKVNRVIVDALGLGGSASMQAT
jgi:glycosyltransferase involved in cell wall biosynthesis